VDEQQQQQVNYSQPVQTKSKLKGVALAIAGVLIAGALFTTGWLIGGDKVSFRSNSLVPVVTDAGSGSAPTDGLDELYRKLTSNFDGDTDDALLLDGLKEGLIEAAGDPFTEYLSLQETKEFNEGLNGTFEGIGAELGKEGNFVVIVAPLKGTPADRAGIQPGDIIIEIDGEDSTDISVTEAVSRIRGPGGEEVVLTVVRDGERVVVPIIRDTINIDSVEWRQEGNIGIIGISRFGDDTVSLTRKAATELKDAGVTGIVLDLRGNPGGLLDASVDVSAIWLSKGTTVLEEKRGGEIIKTYKSDTQPILAGVPTVILINQGSASASEIVAGALKDQGAATLIGEQSFGKGSVQRLLPLDDGGSLKVTIARWFTPNGKNIDKEGISPDTEVELTTEDRKAEADPQLDAALSQLQ
jgi:carboxyl-terminal processing protease